MNYFLGNVGRYYLLWLMVLVFPLGFLPGTTGLLYAHGGDANLIHACVNHGKLRIVGPTEACKTSETALDWNIQGIKGDTGVTGGTGETGSTGATGAQGEPGTPADTAITDSLQTQINDLQNQINVIDPQADLSTYQVMGNIIFVTSQRFDGNLGGLAGADAKCNAAAQNAGLPGTYKATLSHGKTANEAEVNARDRIADNGFPYRRIDGAIIQVSYRKLFFSQIFHSIELDETGRATPVGTQRFGWTGADNQGSALPNDHCNAWTSNSKALSGGVGEAALTTFPHWYKFFSAECVEMHSLYCASE